MKNNKGFAITTIVYSILILLSLSMFIVLEVAKNSYENEKEYMSDVNEELNNFLITKEFEDNFDYRRHFTYNGKKCVVSEENPNICEIEENDKVIYRAEETNGLWKIKFLESGTFVSLLDMTIDVFLVGGGGNGSPGSSSAMTGGGGGGGGYTETFESISLYKDTNYEVEVGLATQPSKFIDNDYEYIALPGLNGGAGSGGNGGSGGGGAHAANNKNVGGSNGSNGTGNTPGIGQSPKNTREFGEADGDLYGGGGGGYSASAGGLGGGGNGAGPYINASNGADNTGGGGGGTYIATAGIGGSGIVVIREHQEQ